MMINRWLLVGFVLSCILAILIPRLNYRTATDAQSVASLSQTHSTVKNFPAASPATTSAAVAIKEVS